MVLDPQLRIYRIVGHPGHFFIGIRYYRDTNGTWQAAPSFRGPWKDIPPAEVPPGLAMLRPT